MSTEQQPSSVEDIAARLGVSPDELRGMADSAIDAASYRASRQPGHNRQTADDLREFETVLNKYVQQSGESVPTVLDRIPDPQEKERAWTLYRRLGAG